MHTWVAGHASTVEGTSCLACWLAFCYNNVHTLQEQSNKAEALVRLYDGIANAAEALGRLAGEELRGAQAEHLEEEAAAKVNAIHAAKDAQQRLHTFCPGLQAYCRLSEGLLMSAFGSKCNHQLLTRFSWANQLLLIVNHWDETH